MDTRRSFVKRAAGTVLLFGAGVKSGSAYTMTNASGSGCGAGYQAMGNGTMWHKAGVSDAAGCVKTCVNSSIPHDQKNCDTSTTPYTLGCCDAAI